LGGEGKVWWGVCVCVWCVCVWCVGANSYCMSLCETHRCVAAREGSEEKGMSSQPRCMEGMPEELFGGIVLSCGIARHAKVRGPSTRLNGV